MSVENLMSLVPVLAVAYALVMAGVAVSAWWRWYRESGARRRRGPVPTAVTGRSGAADTVRVVR